MLLVDTREPESLRHMVKAMGEGIGVDVQERELPFADYVIWPTRGESRVVVGIERKTIGDFLSTVEKKRLDHQIDGLLSSYDHVFLLLVGTPQFRRIGDRFVLVDGRRETGWNFLSFTNLLASLSYRGVYLAPALQNDDQAMAWVVGHHQYLEKERHEVKYVLKPRTQRIDNPAIATLSAIQGIGPSTASLLLSTFGSIFGIVNAADADLRSVRGVGPAAVRSLRLALGGGEVAGGHGRDEDRSKSA